MVALFANWERYFDRMQNPMVQLPRIKSTCPTLYTCLKGDDEDGVYDLRIGPNGELRGFGVYAEIPEDKSIIECITPEMFDKGRLLANKNLKMVNELQSNPPFPAWKDGLNEVWN